MPGDEGAGARTATLLTGCQWRGAGEGVAAAGFPICAPPGRGQDPTNRTTARGPVDLLIVLNPTAGPTDVSPDEIERKVRRYGHNVRIVTTDDDAWVDAIAEGSVVVAAGGDGTVRRVALAVAGTGVAFTVLPLGTANNIARVFGLDPDDLDGIIGAWAAGSLLGTGLDVPILAAGAHGGRFIEAVGAALVAEVAHLVEQRQADGTAEGSMEDGLRALLDHLVTLEPRPWTIDVDGDDLSGDLLAVEVLNTPTIGPGVRLADADPCDGQLDVVIIGPHHRERLIDQTTSRLDGDTHPATRDFDVRRGTSITIHPPAGVRVHCDDHHWVADATCTLYVTVDGLHARLVRQPSATDLTRGGGPCDVGVDHER